MTKPQRIIKTKRMKAEEGMTLDEVVLMIELIMERHINKVPLRALGKKYGVSATTIMNKYNELRDKL